MAERDTLYPEVSAYPDYNEYAGMTDSQIQNKVDELQSEQRYADSMNSPTAKAVGIGEVVAEALGPGKIAKGVVRLEVHSLSAAKLAVLERLGLQHPPDSEVEVELADGRLTEVFPDWSPPQLGIYTVWPDLGPKRN